MNASSLPFSFSRAWGQPCCRGTIREDPGDFRVTEDLGFELDGSGEHAWLRIRKTGDNTGWVAARLARLAGVRPFDVGYAGRKDRHAVTEQWFSCYLPGKPDPDWFVLEEENLEIVSVTRHGKKLRKGVHRGNYFEIKIKMIEDDDVGLAHRLECIREKGFPNYFGEQRFGHEGKNLDQAQRLFAGERVQRAKRDIYISAARGYLFNRVLSDRVDDGTWLGTRSDGRPRTGPLYGVTRKPPLEEDRMPPGLEAWCEGLTQLKVKASRRALAIVPEAFKWQLKENALHLSFGLPSGSYATSLLRELVLYEERVSGQ